MSLAVRASADPRALVPQIRGIVRDLDAELPVFGVSRFDQMIEESLGDRKFVLSLLALFAVLALVLGAVGIYGVMAYTVERRTREIGVRQALGASRGKVVGMVISQGMRLALVGIVLGIGGAYLMRQMLASLLFEISAVDPVTYAVVSGALGIVAALACWVPARRAAAVDPMNALRED
jgi:putative ABC transport system permease protein